MHILYVLTKLELGGAQKICLTLLKGTRTDTLTSSLMSGTEGVLVPEAQKYEPIYLIKSLRREVGIKSFVLELIAFFQMIKRMRALKKKHVNLIVHTHSTKAGIMGRWAAFFAGVKKRVHTVHGFGFHDHQSKIPWTMHFLLEYLTSLITNHYICVSQADQKIGIARFPRFEKKSSIIRAAVDSKPFLFAGTQTTKKQFVFGTVSCLKPQKNLLDLLKAFREMHTNLSPENKQQVLLQIVGDGVERPKLEEWIRENKMAEKIKLLGWQSEVHRWMHSWNAFVMSSLWEGLPCAIIEARLSKLPVISYNIAGIPEVIKENKNGFLIPAGDWKSLSKRMQKLVENKSVYTRMAAYNDDLNDFQNSTMVEKHIKLYKQI